MKYYFVSPYFCSIRGKVRHSYYSCWRWFVVWVFGEIIERSDWSSKEIVITCYRLFNKGHREGLAYDLISSSLETNSKSVVLDIVTRVTRIIISFLEIREFEYELLLQNLLQRGLWSSESMLRSRSYLLTLLWFEEDVSISFFFHFLLVGFCVWCFEHLTCEVVLLSWLLYIWLFSLGFFTFWGGGSILTAQAISTIYLMSS